jgi:tetratricopeptide (TPR) repeat protein
MGASLRIRIDIVCFGFLLVACCTISHAKSEIGNWCEQQWESIAQPFEQGEKRNYDDLLKAWQRYEGKCRGTGVYEARLGQTYLLLNRVDDARNTLSAGKAIKSDYGNLVEHFLLNIEFRELVRRGATKGDFNKLVSEYRQLIATYPDWYVGYEQLGNIMMFLRQGDEAIKLSLDAARLSPTSWMSYRNLAIAYSWAGRHRESVDAANKVWGLRKTVTSDSEFMLAMATSFSELGEFDSAQSCLVVVSAAKPEIRSDPEYSKVVLHVKKKMADAGISSKK